ncbi:MAG: TPM domain-containing protein [Bacteroidales bacterium]|nr:TPM domain-containing protein [Bacteroidales bacterium]MBQ8810979.1 TPM domain-containing protein [Bacteroidales bacterium]
MKPDKFLTAHQQETVVDAVRLAEKGTSGEIRIHIDCTCIGDPITRAKEVFDKLGMHKTQLRNGVLIYLAYESKVFAIIGDKGIDELVTRDFWQDVAAVMKEEFMNGRFTEGLSKAALMVGEKLRDFFPYQEDDMNEQPDDISFGEKEL